MAAGEQLRTQINKLTPELSTPQVSEERYEGVILTEDEVQAALLEGRKRKYFHEKSSAYWDKVNEEEAQPIQPTAEEWLEEFKKTGLPDGKPDMKNPNFENLVTNLCYYFAGDVRFNGKLSKGLMLMGSVGTGKSNLMRFFRHNGHHSFKIVQAMAITNDYKSEEGGEKAIRRYDINYFGKKNQFGQQTYGYCFDDIGTEEIPAKHYTQEKNVISEIMQIRYSNLQHFYTHVTTNWTPEKMEKAYGSRTYDRMKEMFNVISINGIESFRK